MRGLEPWLDAFKDSRCSIPPSPLSSESQSFCSREFQIAHQQLFNKTIMVKKQKLKKAFTKHIDHLKKVKKPPTIAKASPPAKSPKCNASQKITPRIQFPYSESDSILLVGEGNTQWHRQQSKCMLTTFPQETSVSHTP